MSPDCEQPTNVADVNSKPTDDQVAHQSIKNEQKNEKSSSRSTNKTKPQSLPTAPAKKRIKLDQQQRLADDSRPSSFASSSASLTPSPSPKGEQLNDSLVKENLLKENLIKEHLVKEGQHLKENYLRDVQSKDNQLTKDGLVHKSKSVKNVNRPDTPPSADLKTVDQLNSLPALLTPHPALASLPGLPPFAASNPLVNPDLLSSLQHQQQHQQLNSLAQLYSAGNAAAHLLSPNSMKNLKFSIDNILQQKPDQLKNGKFLQENANGLQLSKLHFQLQQHHLQLQKQHMQFKQQQSNPANQSKSPLNENNESNDSTNFSSSMLGSSMVEESKSNLASIWPGWAYCRSYADPASGNSRLSSFELSISI